MIKTFNHKGLQRFFETGNKAGINPQHAPKLSRQLSRLDAATEPQDMNVAGWKYHGLAGDMAGHYAVWVSGNWRLTFKFENGNAVIVDYQDYH
ncbi:MAG: type II toxin-antitoxin system RelE/ParE family toxin [Formosimonas sp.]